MAFLDDFEIQSGGLFNHLSGSTVYDGLAFHAAAQAAAMNYSPVGDDIMSMLQKIPTELEGKRNALRPSLLNMKNGFTIDANAAKYINFCSIVQGSGGTEEQYTGLRTKGTIVAASPVYVVQNGSKLTSYWAAGHVQILVKCETAGAFIDSGLVDVASRKYGQSYSWSNVDLTPGGEQIGVVSTEAAAWQTMTEGECAAQVANIAFDYTHTSYDLNNGNGPQPYYGKITLSGGLTAIQAAQVLHYMCREASTSTINSILGWKYRKLDTSYAENTKFPLGEVVAGTWYVARGWFVAGVGSGFSLIDHNGVVQAPPVNSGLSFSNLVVGDVLLAGRYDAGTTFFKTNEYTLSGLHSAGVGAVTVVEALATDTPTTGTIRLEGYRYVYTSVNVGTKTFTLSGVTGESHANLSAAWVPFLDKIVASTTESATWLYPGAPVTAYYEVRNGNGSPPIKQAINTQVISTGTASVSVIRNEE